MVEALVLSTALLLGAMSDEDDAPAEGSYIFAQTQRADVGGGATKVSADNGLPIPKHGYFPLRVFIDNTTGPQQVVRISFSSNSGPGRPVQKNVEVLAGERRTVVLPVPYMFRYGMLRVRGPGITQRGDMSLYFSTVYGQQRRALSLGSTDDFERWIGHAPAHTTGDVNVLSMPPADAPTELAAYSGFDAVVIPTVEFASLNEAQRRAIESYAATGGTLVLGKASRGLSAVLPLLPAEPRAEQVYGLGKVVVCERCKADTTTLFSPNEGAVNPRGPGQTYVRDSRGRAVAGFSALLPQATAPIGRFLLIIGLFTLAIGPGSIWVARRRGPAALLLTIPGTALLTCSAIIGYSVIQDGFTVHASTRGLTLLDSRQHRALHLGLTAYYANLAPGSAHFSQLVTVMPPPEGSTETYAPSIEWGETAALGSDFVPSRTYREWGFVSAEPTRARVVIKKQGAAWVVQNALGSTISRMVFMADDAVWKVENVREGAEGAAQRTTDVRLALDADVRDRFSGVATLLMERALREGEFLATIEGQGFTPSGGLRLNHHDSSQLVRGEFER